MLASTCASNNIPLFCQFSALSGLRVTTNTMMIILLVLLDDLTSVPPCMRLQPTNTPSRLLFLSLLALSSNDMAGTFMTLTLFAFFFALLQSASGQITTSATCVDDSPNVSLHHCTAYGLPVSNSLYSLSVQQLERAKPVFSLCVSWGRMYYRKSVIND